VTAGGISVVYVFSFMSKQYSVNNSFSTAFRPTQHIIQYIIRAVGRRIRQISRMAENNFKLSFVLTAYSKTTKTAKYS